MSESLSAAERIEIERACERIVYEYSRALDLGDTGGAAVSAQAFPGFPTRLSRYSYLVSLLPESIISDLALDLRLASRSTASYTPVLRGGVAGGLLVERPEGQRTRDSLRALTGSDAEYEAWRKFYGAVGEVAAVVAPTLTQPLPRRSAVRPRGSPWPTACAGTGRSQ